MNGNGLFHFRIAQGQKRLGLQISGKDGEPDPGERENRREIHQAGNGIGRKFGARQPKQIDETHKNQPHRDFRQQRSAALEVARKKRKERNEKMKDKNDNRDDAPRTVEPASIEADFLRSEEHTSE